MKRFLTALLLVVANFFVMPPVEAEIQTYTGTDEYIVGEHETHEVAKNNSKIRAMRNAQDQAGVFIRSRSRMKDLELVDDEVVTITAAVLKVVGAPDYKVRVLDDGKSTLIVTTVTVQIDTDDVDRRLKTIEARENPKPPVDRPKPIEKPAPQPVEKPKPEKVEPPTEKIEQHVEEPAPVEEPKPAEPITPPPVDEPTVDEEPAPRGEIKFFEAEVSKSLGKATYTVKQQLIEAAKDKLRKEMTAFVMKHCKTRHLNITEDEALAAVDYSSKVINIRYEDSVIGGRLTGLPASVKVTGLIYMSKLNAWIDKNLRR